MRGFNCPSFIPLKILGVRPSRATGAQRSECHPATQSDISAISPPTGPNMTAYWLQLPLEGLFNPSSVSETSPTQCSASCLWADVQKCNRAHFRNTNTDTCPDLKRWQSQHCDGFLFPHCWDMRRLIFTHKVTFIQSILLLKKVCAYTRFWKSFHGYGRNTENNVVAMKGHSWVVVFVYVIKSFIWSDDQVGWLLQWLSTTKSREASWESLCLPPLLLFSIYLHGTQVQYQHCPDLHEERVRTFSENSVYLVLLLFWRMFTLGVILKKLLFEHPCHVSRHPS